MSILKLDAACFKAMSQEAAALVARSQAMRNEALRAAEAIRATAAQLQTIDVCRTANRLREMSALARSPRAAA